jgi:hypothetical protein
MVFDRTCRGRALLPGLSHVWGTGQHLYRALGRLDAAHGAASWGEALEWLAAHEAPAPIAEIQFWGHGRWGLARVGDEVLDARSLESGHPHRPALERIRQRLLPGAEGLWWFRTCETFGRAAGHDFARRWSDFLRCRTAGHTYVIGWWQSGLHSLLPGATPTWSPEEGLAPGREAPTIALPSRPGAPNTITCLHGTIPSGY